MDKELENSPDLGMLKAETVATGGILAPAAAPARDALAVGLDIESADNLPASDDPWSEPFYRLLLVLARPWWVAQFMAPHA